MAKAAGKEVAVKAENAVAAFGDQMPDYLKNAAGNRGSEGVGADDMVLPRLEIVQSQSPIKDENEDAKEGYLFNSASGDVIGDVAYFVPIFFRKEYIVWKDKDEGGGYFGSFPSEGEAFDAKKRAVEDRDENPEFLEVVDTPVHFGLLVSPAGDFPPQQIAISMAKSKAKVSRKWNSVIQMCGGDRFSRVYKISTFKDKNAKNQSFFNFVVQPAGFPPEEIYRLAEKTYDVFKTQNVRANHEQVYESESTGQTEYGDV
jgi:hypothetical protein